MFCFKPRPHTPSTCGSIATTNGEKPFWSGDNNTALSENQSSFSQHISKIRRSTVGHGNVSEQIAARNSRQSNYENQTRRKQSQPDYRTTEEAHLMIHRLEREEFDPKKPNSYYKGCAKSLRNAGRSVQIFVESHSEDNS